MSGAEGLEFEEGLEVTLRSELRKSVMSSLGITFEVPSHTYPGAEKGTIQFPFKTRQSEGSMARNNLERMRETTTKPSVRSI